MKKILLTAVNAKYIHSESCGFTACKAYARELKRNIVHAEYIN